MHVILKLAHVRGSTNFGLYKNVWWRVRKCAYLARDTSTSDRTRYPRQCNMDQIQFRGLRNVRESDFSLFVIDCFIGTS